MIRGGLTITLLMTVIGSLYASGVSSTTAGSWAAVVGQFGHVIFERLGDADIDERGSGGGENKG